MATSSCGSLFVHDVLERALALAVEKGETALAERATAILAVLRQRPNPASQAGATANLDRVIPWISHLLTCP